MGLPEIEYARSGDVAIAYQAFGQGPRDLVLVPMFSNLVFPWSNADWREMYEHFASFSRLIILDKRGAGDARRHGRRRSDGCPLRRHLPGADGGARACEHARPRR
jgi:hypothetical protein